MPAQTLRKFTSQSVNFSQGQVDKNLCRNIFSKKNYLSRDAMKFIKSIVFVGLMSFSAGSVMATDAADVNCSGEEVKVCFADGACVCKVRQIQLTDKEPQINECVDQNDTGACDNAD